MRSTATAMGDTKGDPDAGVEQDAPQPMDETTEVATETGATSEVAAEAGDGAEEMVSTGSEEGDATDDETASREETDNGAERPETSSFARLVKGWEALAEVGARNVQRARENESFQPLQMLQQLRLCGTGEGLARIGGPTADSSGDPFEPIILRHTRSTPQQYQPMFPEDDGGGKLPPPVRLEHMRRSSSTPSSSAFRQYNAGSAFGTHLRSMPHLGGPDDRSAFTLPAQRNSFTSYSDSGVRYSAFDPVWLPEASENTAIEVTDGKPAASDSSDTKEEGKKSKGAASRAARFLRMSEGRNKRRRKRSGRDNPARPTTISVSTQESAEKDKSAGDDAVLVEGDPKSTDPDSISRSSPSLKSTIDIDISTTRRTPTPTPQFPSVPESQEDGNADRTKEESGEQYQQLDSDVDEEYEHFQRIEASLHKTESPTPIPSPAYQKFEDEQAVEAEKNTGSGESEGGNRTPTVRIQTEASSSLTPNSQDSGNQSPGTIRSNMTGNTSGHTTIATSTSATTSSGHMSVLSSVSETDMEVMETNQAGKMRIRQQRKLDSVIKRGDVDGSMSVHSCSTGSTNTNGYVALVGSPAPLREGASMPVDRFFDQSRMSVARQASSISGSTGSGGSAGGRTSKTSSDTSRSKKAVTGQGSPASVSSEMATTTSSGSGEEPPKFVSYLDQARKKTLPTVGDDEERESPAEIVGYSEMVFEAASGGGRQGSEKPSVIRPTQNRDSGRDRSGRLGSRSRPPLSPIKGLRTPTTPPPSALGGPDSTSPAYQQLSPPRNIIDHRMGAGLSKPYVLRSSARAGDGRMFVSPESETVDTSPKGWAQGVVSSLVGGVISPESSQTGPVYTYTGDETKNLGPAGEDDPSRDRICEEMSIEVKDAPVVSPEKGA